jgi:hypothetical protein|tara:strand:- start:1635 stop:2087 length:453 start_codon:yes stop_codon:yes gene_type:complete
MAKVGYMEMFFTDRDGGEKSMEVEVTMQDGKLSVTGGMPGPEDDMYWDDDDIDQQLQDALRDSDIISWVAESDLTVLKKNAGITEGPSTMKIKVINSGYGTDMGYKDAVMVGQELDHNMAPVLKVKIADVNMGDPVMAQWRGSEWVVDMD